MARDPRKHAARPVDNQVRQGRVEGQHKSGPGGAGNTGVLGLTPIGGAMGKPTHPTTTATTNAQKITLIRTFVGHSDGREDAMLDRIQRVLDGATLEDLVADELANDAPKGEPTYLYRAYADDDLLIYAGITKAVRRRLNEHRKRSPWYPRAVRFEVASYPSRAAALGAEARCHEETPPAFGWCEPGQRRLSPGAEPLDEFEVLPREVY